MTHIEQEFCEARSKNQAGMTLVEVVVAMAISGLAVASIVGGYVFASRSAEMSALSLAANARAMERLEQTRGAKWDTSASSAADQLVSSNFPNTVVTLDVSGSGTAISYATNVVQITQVSTNPPLKRIRVDCIWRSRASGKTSHLSTNTIETCRGPG